MHGASVSQNKTPVKIFSSNNLLFWQKKAIKHEIWTLLSCWKEIDQFLGNWFGNQDSVLAQGLHGSSVSQNKTPVKVWISNPLAHWKEIHEFLGGRNGKPQFSLCPNFAWPFRVRKWKFCKSSSFNQFTFSKN